MREAVGHGPAPPHRASRGPYGIVTLIDPHGRGFVQSWGSCLHGDLPLRSRFGSEPAQRGSGDEVALKVERVVDGGMHAEEELR
jgi:hypothetical protein